MDHSSIENIGKHLHNFPGGLKLKHYKALSCSKPLPAQQLPLSQEYIIPVSQHLGRPAEIIVSPGQQVKKGQPLSVPGNASSTPGAYVHAPTSGEIVAIEQRPVPHPSGLNSTCIILRADGKDDWIELEPVTDYRQLSRQQLIQRVQMAGIVGLGGAVFPTDIKLQGGAGSIDTLILNGAECEPYISCDETLMKQDPEKIIQGALILSQVLNIKRVLVAIEDPMDACYQKLQTSIKTLGAADCIKVVRVPMLYPEGGERQLIQVLSGTEVPAGKLPVSMGILVLNVATAAAIKDAIIDGKPLIERLVTVTGAGICEPQNVVARIGTPIADLISFCGGYTPGIASLVMGGPLMGIGLQSDSLPIIKASNCILALTHADISSPQVEMPCINCGDCVGVCPAGLLPQTLQMVIRAENFEALEELNLDACIECGCCDYICPSHIPLVDYFRYGKSEQRVRTVERKQSDLAKLRFDRREKRLAKQQTERRARHLKRKQALAGSSDKKDSVAAAIARAKARKQALTTTPRDSDSNTDSGEQS
ncbi:MAG: electron transport complex subunit RsxC [Xanthomonadales bacterium]|nr:electron transport complex subunit RsxC [Xanthomonadales bacterium]